MTLRFAKPLLGLTAAIAAGLLLSKVAFTREAEAKVKVAAKPLRALYITGGCCHDYNDQKKLIPEGVSSRANVEWTVVQEGGTSTNHKVSLYENPKWADGYDVVVHNECFASVKDLDFIKNVINAHKNGTPAVLVHCAMHTFMDLKTDEYREFVGVSTRSHGRQHPLDVKTLKSDHPIMKGFPAEWKTGNEELYAIYKVWPGTTELAKAQNIDDKKDHTIIWEHTYGKGRVFGTTLAHNNRTISDPAYLDMFTRGVLWACDKLDDQGKPKEGFGPQAKAE